MEWGKTVRWNWALAIFCTITAWVHLSPNVDTTVEQQETLEPLHSKKAPKQILQTNELNTHLYICNGLWKILSLFWLIPPVSCLIQLHIYIYKTVLFFLQIFFYSDMWGGGRICFWKKNSSQLYLDYHSDVTSSHSLVAQMKCSIRFIDTSICVANKMQETVSRCSSIPGANSVPGVIQEFIHREFLKPGIIRNSDWHVWYYGVYWICGTGHVWDVYAKFAFVILCSKYYKYCFIENNSRHGNIT